jgi:hypothetical protein
MNTRWLWVVFTIVLATGCLWALQTTSSKVVANVPFGFMAGIASLPAGHYEVAEVTANVFVVSGKTTKNKALVLTTGICVSAEYTPAKLVFRRYGDTYFLAEVWKGEKTGSFVPKTKQEKDVALIAARQAERVTVAGVR